MAENTWELKEFSIQELHRDIDKELIEVPDYQRGVVWTEKQVNDLMDTIKKGLPYGSVLLYKKNDGQHYMIIDGLQRITAVYKFVKEPGRFFNEADIDLNIVRGIASKFNFLEDHDKTERALVDQIKNWVNVNKTMKDIVDMQYVKFGSLLSGQYASLKNHEIELGEMVAPMLANFKELCQCVLTQKVPAIVMKGSDKYLADVFDRINSKGTQLSKYQIYSASWKEDKIKIRKNFPPEIVETNAKRYLNMLQGNLVLENFDYEKFVSTKELNVFELAFGFGKYISNKWPQLFGQSNDKTKIDSVGFNLINCCLCNQNSNLKNMNLELRKKFTDADICNFIEKIIECIEDVDKIIGPYNAFKGNSQKNFTPTPKHTEFQIISIIASVFINKYVTIEKGERGDSSYFFDFSSVNNNWKKNNKSLFEKNVLKIYIMEILSDHWSGTGDKKMDAIIQNPLYYTKDVSETEFTSCISTWFKKMNEERNEISKISSPKEGELILLATLYINKFSAKMHLDASTYDIEHLATKKLMRTHLENKYKGTIKLPISSFGNLCYLPSSLNRRKHEKVIYDDTACISNEENLKKVETFTFTKKEDFDFLYNNRLGANKFRDAYFAFINKRFNIMLDEIVKSLFK